MPTLIELPALGPGSAKKGSLLRRSLLATAAVVVIVWAVLFQEQNREARHQPLARIAAAAAELKNRPVEPRLAALPYAPYSASKREKNIDARLLKLRGVAGEVVLNRDANTPPDARGIASLLAGYPDEAVRTLTRAASELPADPVVRSDLAAARYVVARKEQDPRELVRALASADAALRLDSRFAPALFNRALVLETLHLADPAVAAYQEYLHVDAGSAWATEARQRAGALRKRRRSELWDEERVRLEQAAASGDMPHVRTIVSAFTQEARSWGELIVLNEWAAGVEAKNPTAARRALTVARATGLALQERTGERLLSDAVVAAVQTTDPLGLAHAQLLYGRGREQYRDRSVAAALRLFMQAQSTFSAAGNPMALVCAYYHAMCLDDLNQVDTAGAILSELSRRVNPAYRSLRAQIEWQYGARFSRAGQLNEALAAQQRALEEFTSLGERNNSNFMRIAAAGSAAALGRDMEAWRIRTELFQSLSESGDHRAMQAALDLAARTEALTNRWDCAHALLTLAVSQPYRVNPRLVVDDLLWSALAAARSGDPQAADHDLRSARAAITALKDASLRASAQSTAMFVEARIARDPRYSIKLLDRAIEYMTSVRNPFLLPEALSERARHRREIGDEERAIADLRAALRLIEQRRGLPGDAFRDTYFATADAASEQLTDALEQQGRTIEALLAADSNRGRSIADHVTGRVNPIDSGARWWVNLPKDIVLVEYQSLESRVIVFTIDRGGVQVRTSAIRRDAILSAVGTLLDSPDSVEGRRAGERLYETLILPIPHEFRNGETLVVVPDKTLIGLPFAALRDPRQRRYLIENVPVVVSPNAGMYVASALRRRNEDSHSELLALGDPAFDRERFPSFARLSGARREIQAVASMYRTSETLLGEQATRAAFFDRLPSFSTIHLAAHAVSVKRDPENSFLLLAPTSGNSGAIYGREIAARSLPRRPLIVLAGCRTAAPAQASTDLTSLSLSFLAAGASTVVGTVWDADDETSLRFSESFHRLVQQGCPPEAAARLTQLAMLHSSDPRLKSVHEWGAFQVVRSGF